MTQSKDFYPTTNDNLLNSYHKDYVYKHSYDKKAKGYQPHKYTHTTKSVTNKDSLVNANGKIKSKPVDHINSIEHNSLTSQRQKNDVSLPTQPNDINDHNTQKIYKQWQYFIETQVGFILPDSQENWLWQAVNRLSRETKLSPEELLDAAKIDKGLIQEVIEAVLIPQTQFFRHQPTLDFISNFAQNKYGHQKGVKRFTTFNDTVNTFTKSDKSDFSTSMSDTFIGETPISETPSINEIKNNSEQLNRCHIWSVGCSFGQEVWSISMTLAAANLPYKIWGLDANKSALNQAKQGRYALKSLSEIPSKYKKFILTRKTHFEFAPKLYLNNEFLHYNLVLPNLPDLPLVDIIVCQNVLIYFRGFEQRDILSRLIKRLNVGGYLILAPGEATNWQHPVMKRQNDLQVNAWQKVR